MIGKGLVNSLLRRVGIIGESPSLAHSIDQATSEYRFSHSADNTGIALSTQLRNIVLVHGTDRREYPFTDIRRWERIWLLGTPQVTTSVMASRADRAHAKEIDHANRSNSGLFIEVRDIQFPRWRVAFDDYNDLTRWCEILQQCVNEMPSQQHVVSHNHQQGNAT